MGLQLKSSSGIRSDINVTPLVDVVLVLLIIFMVVMPLLEKELPVKIPEIEKQNTPITPEVQDSQVVVQIKDGGKIFLNSEEMTQAQFGERIQTIAKTHKKDEPVFFDAEDSANYGSAISVLDLIRSAGIEKIGMMMPDAEALGAPPVNPPAPPAP